MELINNSVEIIEQGKTMLDGLKLIASISNDVSRSSLCKNNISFNDKEYTFLPLKFFTLYLTIPKDVGRISQLMFIEKYSNDNNKTNNKVISTQDKVYITTDLGTVLDNNWNNDLNFVTERTFHHERIIVKIVCSLYTRLFLQTIPENYIWFNNEFTNPINLIILDSDVEDPNGDQLSMLNFFFGEKYKDYISVIENMSKSKDCNDLFGYNQLLPLCTATKCYCSMSRNDWMKYINLYKTSEIFKSQVPKEFGVILNKINSICSLVD